MRMRILVGLVLVVALVALLGSLKEMRPIDALNDNRIPTLFFHGADDTFITPQNSRDMYERTQGERKIYLVEGAGHAESVLVDPEGYRAHVEGFLARL